MSLVLTVYVREGIIMAADSRITLDQTTPSGTNSTIHLAVGMSDTNRKIFVTENNIGINTYGTADINRVPIAGFIDSFIRGLPASATVKQTADELLNHFCSYNPVPQTTFYVAGYNKTTQEQEVYLVEIMNHNVVKMNQPNDQGVVYGGEYDVVSRLIQPVFLKDSQNNYQPLPTFPIPYSFFTIQDAVDFSVYLIKTTIDTMRFQSRHKTVGGYIDVLFIHPTGFEWVAKKVLKV